MPDVEAVAAPSAAEPSTKESFVTPRSGTPEYAAWRNGDTLPEKSPEAKTVEPPATATPKAETAVSPEPAAGKQQESRRKPDAEARIKALTDEAAQLRKDLEEARKPKEAKADPPPARPAETNPKPKVDDQVDGKPKYATYEDYVEALADWKAEERFAKRDREQAQAKQLETYKQKVDAAESRYPDFRDKALPVAEALMQDGVSRELQSVLNDSPVFPDLLYAIGGDAQTMADFLKAARENPSKALRVALIMEQEIVKELSKGSESAASTERNEQGQFVAKPVVEAPAKRGPESAPKPPIEISARGGGSGNVEAQMLSDLEAQKPGAFQRWKQHEDAKDRRALRGA